MNIAKDIRRGKIAMYNESELKELIKKADAGNKIACAAMGDYYSKLAHTNENMKKAFYYYKKAADLGHDGALFKVAFMTYEGEGTRKDVAAAANYTKSLADKGYTDAQYAIAIMFKNGECGFFGAAQKAFKYFTSAAEQGHAPAQIELGRILFFEKHLIDQAIFWWACAYVHGSSSSEASNKAKDLFNDLVESGLPRGYERITKAIEDVQQSKYNTYTHNPKK